MNFDAAALDGLLADGNAEALYELASSTESSSAIVEIGAFRGASTVCLARGAKAGHKAKVWSIDPWNLPGNPYGRHGYSAPETMERYEAQLRKFGVRSHVTTIQAFSNDAAVDWAGPTIGLLFIDGDHTYRGVRTDIEAWSPHLGTVHVIAFDDYGTKKNPGVAQAVGELVATGNYTMEVHGSSLAVATPVAP